MSSDSLRKRAGTNPANLEVVLGSAPYAEARTEVWHCRYESRALAECATFIEHIRRSLGPEPPGAELLIGARRAITVICVLTAGGRREMHYAFLCEFEGPSHWDAVARRDLAQRLALL